MQCILTTEGSSRRVATHIETFRMNLARFAFLSTLVAAWLAVCVSPHQAEAQTNPRFGLGFNSMLSSADGFGIGFRGRASAPVNRDLSIGIDVGFTGFVLSGRRDADYVFDPQLSAIINLPQSADRAGYILFGLGGYLPVGEGTGGHQNGPTIHIGLGWVRALQETSLFYEVDPALIIGEHSVDIAIPLRIGVIF